MIPPPESSEFLKPVGCVNAACWSFLEGQPGQHPLEKLRPNARTVMVFTSTKKVLPPLGLSCRFCPSVCWLKIPAEDSPRRWGFRQTSRTKTSRQLQMSSSRGCICVASFTMITFVGRVLLFRFSQNDLHLHHQAFINMPAQGVIFTLFIFVFPSLPTFVLV